MHWLTQGLRIVKPGVIMATQYFKRNLLNLYREGKKNIASLFPAATGMTQRDGMGREVGGEFRMGSTCTPVADSC